MLTVENCSVVGSEMMNAERTWADTDSLLHPPSVVPGQGFSGFPGCTPPLPPRRSLRSTYQNMEFWYWRGCGRQVLRGLKAAAKDDGRRKGEGTVRLDSGS